MSLQLRRVGCLALFCSLVALAFGGSAVACGGSSADEATPAVEAGTTETDAAEAVDAGPAKTPAECFAELAGPVRGPDYDAYHPTMGGHCAGTQMQRITGVEKLVFLGDSITAGTPPTTKAQFYASLVTAGIKERFGEVEVSTCAKYGARVGDLLAEGDAAASSAQIGECFPSGVEAKKTLVVMTMGGNDVSAWIGDAKTASDGKRLANEAADTMGRALAWLKSPDHFPNGSYVIFGNAYEFTDGTSDLQSCPSASLFGLKGTWPMGAEVTSVFAEGFMKQAVATQTDMIFMLENFCGHGFHHDDPNVQCYRGEGAENWFDLTCIHPTPTGHARIAEYVLTVVDGIPMPRP